MVMVCPMMSLESSEFALSTRLSYTLKASPLVLSTTSISVPSWNTPQRLAPMLSIMRSILASSFSSRVVVLAMRMGIPKISAKVSQNASAFFFGMVCVAALRNSPRSSGCPASMSQSVNGACRYSSPVVQSCPRSVTTRPYSGMTCLRGMSFTPS